MYIIRPVLFVAALLVGSAFTAPAPAVKLAYAFKVGDVYLIRQNTQQSIKQTIMGMDQTADNVYTGEMQFKVASLTTTGAKLETEFLKLNNTMKSVMGETSMNSEGPQDVMENKLMKAMMNKKFFVLVNAQGGVEGVEGEDNLWSGIGELGLDEEKTASVKQMLNQYFSAESIKSSFEQALVYYTDKKIKAGDTWTSRTKLPLDFPIETDNTWSLASLSGATAKVNCQGKYLTTDKEKQITLPGGFKAKVDLGGTQTVNANVNVSSGWPTDMAIASTLKGTMILLAGGMIPADMEVPMEIGTKTSYVFTKK